MQDALGYAKSKWVGIGPPNITKDVASYQERLPSTNVSMGTETVRPQLFQFCKHLTTTHTDVHVLSCQWLAASGLAHWGPRNYRKSQSQTSTESFQMVHNSVHHLCMRQLLWHTHLVTYSPPPPPPTPSPSSTFLPQALLIQPYTSDYLTTSKTLNLHVHLYQP